MEKRNICILNDSFPPQIDGVSNAVYNYASIIEEKYGHSVVITPDYPGADDSRYPFPVYRYKSLDLTKQLGVVAGMPFSPEIMQWLQNEKIDLYHCHTAASSIILARSLRSVHRAPLIMTYHTKYEVDIRKVVKAKLIADKSLEAIAEAYESCDEVWAVSRGAGENLKSIGYKGDYVVMENGVDLPRERVSDEEIRAAVSEYDLPENVPVFIFVGRMMWYKGIRLIIDALAGLHLSGLDFRMLFVGTGSDLPDILEAVEDAGISEKCIFTGAVRDRNKLRALYCRADLQLFPSTFDTNGLVVGEAAACSVPSVLIAGSCAAERVTDGRNGYLVAENAVALALRLSEIVKDRGALRQVGENASKEIYLSWADSVKKACERYEVVIENFRMGKYPEKHHLNDAILRQMGELMETLGRYRGAVPPWYGIG